jgi:DNA replication protein DnaC
MSKIEETLKKIAGDTSKVNSQNSSSTDPAGITGHDLPGDPNCPYCGGTGYLRLDVPLGHPEFGRLQLCACRQQQVGQQIRQRLFALSNLDELCHLTFENFQPRGHIGLAPRQADSLELAYNHARQYAQSLNGWLLLQGGYGCGKTHLAAAIANFTVSVGVPTLFITVPDMLDTLRFAYGDPDETFESRFEDIRSAGLLVLDDFGTQNATSWAQEKLFQILNYRYINHLPTVVTTNLIMEDMEGRIRSRLQDPQLVTMVHILAPDYRNPTDDSSQSELSSLNLLRNRTFASFDMRRQEGLTKEEAQSLEKAFQAALAFAEKPQGWLVLMGNYGCGKTHLAAAIANYRVDLGYDPIFVVVPDLLDHLRATFNPASSIRLDRRFEEVRTARLLILDDLGTQSMTPWVREKLYQLFNYRYNAELPTVITTSDELKDVDPRIRSRMLDQRQCRIMAVTTPAYKGIAESDKDSATSRRRRS